MRKFLSIVLIISMLFSVMSVAVFAESEITELAADENNAAIVEPEVIEEEVEADSVRSTDPPFYSGVYRFDSMYNTNMCMQVEEDGYTSGSLVLQWNNSSNSRETLFKIEYVGYGNIPATGTNAHYYVIRSMMNSGIGLTAATVISGSNAVTLQTLSTNNNAQSWTQYWVYTENSGCDIWMNAATGTCLGVPNTVSNGAELEMTSSTTNAMWQLSQYTGSVIEGVGFISGSSSVYGGGYGYYNAYMYSSRIGVNGPVSYAVYDTDGTSTDKAEMSGSRLIADKAGSVRVVASASGVSSTASYTVNITGYSSADYAAEGFGYHMYEASSYCRFIYTAMIYKKTVSGVTTYYYGNISVGTPHEFSTSLSYPSGSTAVAVVYIELDDYTIDAYDRAWCNAIGQGLDLYGIVDLTGDKNLLIYEPGASNAQALMLDIATDPLTSSEMSALETLYGAEWDAHIAECDECSELTWPND